jgi:hypothetical protein
MTGLFIKNDITTDYTHIGRMNYGFTTNSVNAYIRGLKIRKEAVYTSNFTPPILPFAA